jgi:hypothetical protein
VLPARGGSVSHDVLGHLEVTIGSERINRQHFMGEIGQIVVATVDGHDPRPASLGV